MDDAATRSLPGLGISGGWAVDAPRVLDLAVEATQAGMGPVLFTEVSGPGAIAMSTGLAARVPGVVTGTGIVPLASRTDATLAMGARTAAQIAGATYLLGVGVSSSQIVGDWHAADHEAGLAATQGRLRAIRALLGGERRGAFRLGMPGRADVRVLLGAMGPRMVEMGLRVADGVILNHTPPDALPDAAAADGMVIAYTWVLAAPDGEARARREIVSYAMADPYAAHFARLGYATAVEQVRALHAEGRLREAPATLPDEMVSRLYTAPEELPAQLDAVRAAGAVPVLMPVTGEDPCGETRALIARLTGAPL